MSPIARSKHAVLLDTLPEALQGVAKLRAAGDTETAAAMQYVADYAQAAAQAEVDAAAKRPSDNRTLSVTRGFKHRVQRLAKAEGASIPDVVRKSLEDYLDGEWTPTIPDRAPRGQAVRGTSSKKVILNVRVPHEVWDAANEHGKTFKVSPKANSKVTASAVSIAALVERFGEATADDEAAAEAADSGK